MTPRARLDRLQKLWSAGDEETGRQLAAQFWLFLAWEPPPEAPAARQRRWLQIAHAYGLPPRAEAEALRRALLRLGLPADLAREAAAGGVAPQLAAVILPDGTDEAAVAALLREVRHETESTRGARDVVVEEELVVQALWPHGEVVLDRLDPLLLQRDGARLLPLAVADVDGAAVEVDVPPGEGAQLAHADAGLQEDLQDGVVAWVAPGQRQELGVLVQAQGRVAAALLFGGLHAEGRVLGDEPLRLQEAEVLPQRGELAGAGGAAVVLLGQVGEELGDVGAGDIGGGSDQAIRLGQEAGELR